MKKVIVVDIDGTLADINHRRAFVRSKPKNWPAFNQAMKFDTPNNDVVWLFKTLQLQSDTAMLVASGRGEENRATTEQWLADNGVIYEKLYMREAKDYRQDYIVKSEILEQIRTEFGNPFLWIDDRKQVVDAIRANGVRVLQVDEGDF